MHHGTSLTCHCEERSDVAISQYHIGYHESSGETVTAFPRLPRWPAASSQWHIRAVWRCTSALTRLNIPVQGGH